MSGFRLPESTPSSGLLVQPAPINHDWLSLVIGACAVMHRPGYFDSDDQDYVGDMVSDVEFLLVGTPFDPLTDSTGAALTDTTGDYLTA